MSLFLKNGISIDELKIGSFYVEELYLKLDKKIIIHAKRLVIPQEKRKRNLPNIEKTLNDIKNILNYFQFIELKDVEFKNNHYTLLYRDKIIYMKNDEFEMALDNVYYLDDKIYAKVKLLKIKKYNLRIFGDFVYSVDSENILIKANAEYRDINSRFVFKKKDKKVYFVVKTDEFRGLKPLIDELKLSEILNIWIYQNVQAKKYKIKYLKGIVHIDGDDIRVEPESISAEVVTKDVKIKFHPKLESIRAKSMKIIFKDRRLIFDLKEPYFKRSSLNGSRVILDGFGEKYLNLSLDLKIKTKFDKSVKEILDVYGVDIPIVQRRGLARAKLKIDIPLKKRKDVKFSGKIELKKSRVEIGDITLPIAKADILIDNNIVKVSNVLISNHILNVMVDGSIYLKEYRAELLLDIKKLKDKKSLLDIKEKKETLLIDYKKDIIFKLENLSSKIKYSRGEKSISIDIPDINKIKPYLEEIPLDINSGSIIIKSRNLSDYSYVGKFQTGECFFYKDDDSCLSIIPIYGKASSKRVLLNAFDDRLTYNSKLSTLTLNSLNLDLEKLFYEYQNDKNGTKSKKSKRITVIGNSSTIRYKEYKLLTDKYKIDIDKKGDFSFNGNLQRDKISINMHNRFLTIKAKKITDKMLHPLINFKGLQKGKYTIKILKNQEGISKGSISIDGGVMRDFKTYNNIMAFINTIPSLATLHKPGFSKNGFKIKSGTIKFTIDGDILKLKSILIEGASATISGSGVLNLKQNTISVDLIIMTAREVSKIIKNLPIVGHIILGDKNSVSVGLKVRGSLDSPKIRISAIKDLMFLPIEIIKRALSSPSYIYKRSRNPSKEVDGSLDMY